MKLESNGIFNSVSLGTSHISKEQFQILLKLRADVVMALDKDKNPLDDKNFNLLAKYNRCYIMEDKNGLLGEKDAPIDQGIEVFQKLYNERRLVL
jgi:DNA primase